MPVNSAHPNPTTVPSVQLLAVLSLPDQGPASQEIADSLSVEGQCHRLPHWSRRSGYETSSVLHVLVQLVGSLAMALIPVVIRP